MTNTISLSFVRVLMSLGICSVFVGAVWAKPLRDVPSKKASGAFVLLEAKGTQVRLAQQMVLPRIEPVAPLPSVFRKVRLTSKPTSAKVVIKQGIKVLPCQPANRTPCTFEVVGDKQVRIDIFVRRKDGQLLRYQRSLTGRTTQLDTWQLTIPTVLTPTIMTPKSIKKLPPKRTPPPKSGPPSWVWGTVAVGVAVVAVAAVGIGVAVATQNQVGFTITP